jgi:hypothetical protein
MMSTKIRLTRRNSSKRLLITETMKDSGRDWKLMNRNRPSAVVRRVNAVPRVRQRLLPLRRSPRAVAASPDLGRSRRHPKLPAELRRRSMPAFPPGKRQSHCCPANSRVAVAMGGVEAAEAAVATIDGVAGVDVNAAETAIVRKAQTDESIRA